ncbi:MAG: CAP domain-containing protein [Burkholderiaceae bacterium]
MGYDAERLAAFNRLNEIRLSAGLGMVAQNALLDQAAQAHADWMIANDAFVHEEAQGTTGFTGAHFWDRDEALGYVPIGGWEEMSAGSDGSLEIDALVNTLYHRIGIISFEPVDVGVGRSTASVAGFSVPLVIDITRPGTDAVRGVGQAAQPSIQGVAIWPLNNAHGVPTRLGYESPNPTPDRDVMTLGTPVSVTVDRLQTIQVSSFSIEKMATGTVIPTVFLASQNDPNSLIPASFVAVVPLAPLDVGTTYRVSFTGTAIAFPSGSVVNIDRTWSFTTVSQ